MRLKLRNTLCGTLATVTMLNSIAFANFTCEVAAQPKVQLAKTKTLNDYFGENTWEVQLAAAELLYKFGNKRRNNVKSGSIQINHNTQVLLNSIVAGKLTEEQYAMLESYQPYLANAMEISTLTARTKLASMQTEVVVPQAVADSFVTVKMETPATESKFAKFIGQINPKNYLDNRNPEEKKYGPVTTYIHAEQMVEDLVQYPAEEHLSVLKYMLGPIEIFAPKEIIRLIKEVPVKDQLAAFDFLDAKRVGRYDFFPLSELVAIKSHLEPQVVLKIIAAAGDNWELPTVIKTIKEIPQIQAETFGESLYLNYSPTEIQEYLQNQTNIDLPEAKMLLSLILPNAHNTDEKRVFYNKIVEKLYHAEEKKSLESYFNLIKDRVIKIAVDTTKTIPSFYEKNRVNIDIFALLTAIGIVGGMFAINDPMVNESLKQSQNQVQIEQKAPPTQAINTKKISLTANEFKELKKSTDGISTTVSLMESRILSGDIKTAHDFLETLDPITFMPTENFLDSIGSLWSKYAIDFVKLNPTNKEFNSAKAICGNDNCVIALIKARLNHGNLQSGTDVIETFKLNRIMPNQRLLDQISEMKATYYKQ